MLQVFLKTHDVKGLNELDKIDLIIVNFKLIKDKYKKLIKGGCWSPTFGIWLLRTII